MSPLHSHKFQTEVCAVWEGALAGAELPLAAVHGEDGFIITGGLNLPILRSLYASVHLFL